MQVAAIWRHPVKSLQGEQLAVGAVDPDGCGATGPGASATKTPARSSPVAASPVCSTRRRPSRTTAADRPAWVAAGEGPATDAALTDWLGRPVSLVAAAATPGGRAEYFADATDDTSAAIDWTMPAGRFVDAMPLLVLTTASLRAGAALHPAGAWDVRTFRPTGSSRSTVRGGSKTTGAATGSTALVPAGRHWPMTVPPPV